MEWDNLAGKAELAGTKDTLKAFVPKDPLPARKPDAEPKAKAKKVAQVDIDTAIPCNRSC